MYKQHLKTILEASDLKDVFQVDTLTFPAKASVTIGDYINVYAQDGTHYALQLDTTGTDADPTGALWAAADYTGKADISSDTTAATVAATAETALNALTGFTAAIATDDTAADGTMTLTQENAGVTTNPVPKNADDSGDGSITTSATTAGFAQPDVASDVEDIRHIYGYAVKIKWTTSTAVATVKVQEGFEADGSDWSDVTDGSQDISAATGCVLINLPDRMAPYMRVLVDYTSGTITTLEVISHSKG